MADAFQGMADSAGGPAGRAAAVAPSDTGTLADVPKALFVGTGGTVIARGTSGGDAVFKNVASGTILPLRATAVKATGTTAADIVALY